MEQLSGLVSNPDVPLHTRTFANNAVLRRLQDDNYDVVRMAMLCPFDENGSDLCEYYNAVRDAFDQAAMSVWKNAPFEGNALSAAMQV